MKTNHPVVVVGAGPIGLSAAANLVERDIPFVVLEAGSTAGAAIRQWGHVPLFSPWVHCIDPASRRLLEETDWSAPDDQEHPTGADLVDRYLEPLSRIPAIAEAIHFSHRVTAVSRFGIDKTRPAGREDLPFVVAISGPDGDTELLASAVIDASGTWTQPNPIGSSGIPAVGERASAEIISNGIPDVAGAELEAYSGSSVAVIGSGHSAQNVVRAMGAVAAEDPATKVTWIVRREQPGQMFGGGSSDELAERGALGAAAAEVVSSGGVEFVTGFRTREVIQDGASAWLVSLDGRKLGPFDRIVNTTGFRPNLEMLRELRLDLDDSLEAASQLAPLIDPNHHSCGTVPPHGSRELAQPEQDFYIIGNKSYGRAPTFLLLTGYEQARSVVAAVAGDEEAATRVELTLPETGVCSVDLGQSRPGALPILNNSCC